MQRSSNLLNIVAVEIIPGLAAIYPSALGIDPILPEPKPWRHPERRRRRHHPDPTNLAQTPRQAQERGPEARERRRRWTQFRSRSGRARRDGVEVDSARDGRHWQPPSSSKFYFLSTSLVIALSGRIVDIVWTGVAYLYATVGVSLCVSDKIVEPWSSPNLR